MACLKNMALESFKSKKPGETKSAAVGDIRRLGIPEIQQKPESESQRMFAALKQTPLYDPKTEQWKRVMNEYQEITDEDFYTLEQLLGIYTQSLFARAAAQKRFSVLEKSDLFHDGAFWQETANPGMWASIATQCTGLLLEMLSSLSIAKEKFQILKTNFYNPEEKVWRAQHSAKFEVPFVGNELYIRWVETELFPEKAESLLAELKTSNFYDQKSNNWRSWRTFNQPAGRVRDVKVRLLILELLIEAQYAPEMAHKRYQELKASAFYDAERQQWNSSSDLEGNIVDSARYTLTQFLGIILEQRFEHLSEERSAALAAEAPAMPLEKNI